MSRNRNRNRRNPKEKSKIVAALLAFVFGFVGAHKFYLRNSSAGIFYIFLMIISNNIIGLPISAMLGIFDAIRLLTMSEDTFDRKHNRHIQRERPQNTRREQTTVRRRHRVEPVVASKAQRKKVNPFRISGIKKYKEFELDGAIVDFKEGLKIDKGDIALHFNIACAYSLTEQKDLAYYHISEAIQYGYKDLENIQTHDDLAFVRIQPEYEEFKKAGFILKPAAKTNDSSNKEVKDDALLSQLNKLAELRKRGLLSEDEFLMEKNKILRT